MSEPRRVLKTGGLYFDGIDDRIVILNSESLNPTSSASWVFWAILSKGNGVNKAIFCKYGYDPSLGKHTGWDIYVASFNNLRFFFRHPQNVYVDDISPIFQEMVCYTLVNNGSFSRLYRNGNMIAQQSMTLPAPSPHAVTIGSRGVELYGNHIIAEVRLYNRALSDAEVQALYNGVDIRDGLVLYLPFDEGEGNIAYDRSGYNNNGTIYGNPRWVVKKPTRTSKTGGMYFDGINSYGCVGIQPDGSGTPFTVYGWDAVTVVEWFRVDDPRIEVRRTGTIGNMWDSCVGFTNVRITYPPYGITARTEVRKPDATRSIYMADVSQYVEGKIGCIVKVMSLSPKMFCIYANGSQIYSVNIPSDYVTILEHNPNTPPYAERNKRFVLGAGSQLTEYMKCMYSEVRIYNRALSDTEIQALYNGADIKDGLKLHLKFDEGEGNVVYDKSGNNNHAILYGKPRWIVKKSGVR